MRAATFTTYINAQIDPGLEAAFDRQTKLATASYGTITTAAEQATRATAGLLGGRGTAGIANAQTRAIKEQVKATEGIVTTAARAERASVALAAGTRRQAQEASNAAKSNTALSRSLQTTATALNVVQGPLGPLAGRVGAVGRAITDLTGIQLGLVGLGAAVFAIGRTATTYANLESRLRPLYSTQTQVNRAFDDVVGIATRARSALEPVLDLYVRLKAVGADVGISAQRASGLTEIAAKAATLSGGNAQTREAGLGQFSQAIGSNNLGGDELRSIKENTFALAQAIAQGYRNVDGSIGTTIGKLKELGSEGKLTADVVADALERSRYRIEYAYSRLPKTLSTATTELNNSLLVTVGRFDQALGFTSNLANLFSLAANNLRIIVGLAGGMGAAFAASKVVPYLDAMTGRLARAIDMSRQLRRAQVEGAVSLVSPAGRQAAVTAGAAVTAVDASRAAQAEVASTQRIIDVRRAQLAVARENYAISLAEQNLAVSGRDARVPALEERLALERQQQTVLSATIAQETAASRADIEAKAAQVDASRARVVALRAELQAVADLNAAANTRVQAGKLGSTLIAANPTLQEGYKESLLARNTLYLAQAQREVSTTSVKAQIAARSLAVALEEQRTATVAYGLAARSANESAAVGFGRLRQAETAARAVAAAEQELATATAARAAAQVAAVDSALVASTTRLANASGRAGFAQLALAEATVTARIAEEAAAVATERATIAQRALAVSLSLGARAAAGARAALASVASTVLSLNFLIGVATAAFLLYATSTSKVDDALQRLGITQEDTATRFDRIAAAARGADTAARGFYRTKIANDVAADRTAAEDVFADVRNRVGAAASTAERLSDPKAAAELRRIQGLISPDKRVSGAAAALNSFARSNPNASAYLRRDSASLGVGPELQLGRDTRLETIINGLATADAAAAKFNQNLGRARNALGQLNDAGKPTSTGATPVLDAAALRTNAQVAALSKGASTLREVQAKQRQALNDLDREFGVKNGAVPAGKQGEYQQRAQAIYQQAEQEREAIKSSTAAATAQRVAARQAESDRLADLRRADAERAAEAQTAANDKRNGALQQLEEDAPGISRDAYLSRRLAILRTYDDEVNAIGKVGAASNDAGAQELRDRRAITAEIRSSRTEFENQLAVSRLLIQGREDEAEATRRVLDMRQRIGSAADAEYPRILQQVQAEQQINDVLESRSRITSLITGSVDEARTALSALLNDIGTEGPKKAATTFLNTLRSRVSAINTQSFVEKVFAGADQKVRDLIAGRTSIDRATDALAKSVGDAESGTDALATATERAAERINQAAEQITNATVRRTAAGGATASIDIGSDGSTGGVTGDEGEVIVTGSRQSTRSSRVVSSRTPGGSGVFNAIGSVVGGKLDLAIGRLFGNSGRQDPFAARAGNDAIAALKKGGLISSSQADTATSRSVLGLGSSTFFSKIGASFGTALEGAGQGAIASGFAKALGVRQSGVGSQIGGALGGLTGIPGGALIGGLLGGTLGGALKTTKQGAATLQYANGTFAAGSAFGNDAASQKNATGAAGSVADGLNKIASALGVDFSNVPNITIGQRHGDYRVQTGSSTSLKINKGAVEFDDDAQGAIEYAVRYAVQNSVITGISKASINILKSGQDLEKAIEKATLIESIPKRLLQRTDPVRYAVQTLNTEFEQMIAVLKEGGASAEQLSEAQKLYDLERADAIANAAQQANDAITQFLTGITATTASPLNKATVYENAGTALSAFKGDIQSGKAVDQTALVTAAQNFQEASRALYGSSEGFFADFDMLRTLLMTARDNAGITSTDVTTLPASPFSTDTAVRDAIASLQTAQVSVTQDQTAAIVAGLASVVDAVESLRSADGSGYQGSAIGLLTGFAA